MDHAIVLHWQGDIAGANQRYDTALAIYRNIDDKYGIAKILKNKGNIAHNLTEAQEYWEQSLAIFRKIGNKSGMAAVLDDIGGLLASEGHLSAARQMFEEEDIADCLIRDLLA